MTLAFLERQLRDGLDRLGRHDLAEAAAGRVTFTDDGSTVYLHLFPREGWPHKHPGQAFVLAWADYVDMRRAGGLPRAGAPGASGHPRQRGADRPLAGGAVGSPPSP